LLWLGDNAFEVELASALKESLAVLVDVIKEKHP
jgi:hypothetical protein